MARVLVAKQAWGVQFRMVGDRAHAWQNLACSIDTTVYAASSGSTPVSSFTTNDAGELPGWVEEGTYNLTVNGTSTQVSTTTEGRTDSLESDSLVTTPHVAVLREEINVKAPEFWDLTSGTDRTASFVAALSKVATGAYSDANKGGMVQVPPDTYIVDELDIQQSFQGLVGTGIGATLKAKAGAAYVVKIEGRIMTALKNLTIDGNSQASHGVRILAIASGAASEMAFLEHCRISQCDRGLSIETPATGIVSQADVATYLNVYINACNTGVKIDAENAQQQAFYGCKIQASDVYGIDIKRGGLLLVGSQIGQAGGTGIYFSGTWGGGDEIYGCHLINVILEGQAVCIDGATGWPRHGVKLDQTVLGTSAPSTGVCIRLGVASPIPVLHAVDTQFAGGTVELNSVDATFLDINSDFTAGAAVVKGGGATQARHMKWDPIGLTFNKGEIVATAVTGGRSPFIAREHPSGQTAALFQTRDSSDTPNFGVLPGGKLGVGNSASATEVIGKAVVKKIEIFTANGTSLGFIPVYSSIT